MSVTSEPNAAPLNTNQTLATELQAQRFLSAMAGTVAQVSVVTTDGAAGRFGVTVSSFTSVSAAPPLELVCLNRHSPAVAAVTANGCFAVNLLAAVQTVIADCFSGRATAFESFDFACAEWRLAATGAPCLVKAAASFDCTIENVYDAGSHRIFIGRVVALDVSASMPLAVHGRRYHRFHPIYQEQT